MHDVCSAECDVDEVECGLASRRMCIPDSWQCDGDDDCGDNSDELPVVCGQFTYRASYKHVLADISRSRYVAIATQPVHRLQIRPIVHN